MKMAMGQAEPGALTSAVRRLSRYVAVTLLSIAGWLTICAGTAAAQQQTRVALVIGNAAYTTIHPLKNSVNDARMIRDALRRIGFEVIYREDVDEVEMQRAIADFGARMNEVGPDGVALFYYAGHGVQSSGENFLLPVDIAVEREADLRVKAMRAVDVLAQMQGAPPRVKIVILDACRDNPFAVKFAVGGARQGLADIALGNFEFTLGFAATAGKTAFDGDGSDGPYAIALARRLTAPDAELFEVFRQVADDVSTSTSGRQLPEFRSTLRPEVYLNPVNIQVAQTPKPASPAAPSTVKVAAADAVVGKWCQASRGAVSMTMFIAADSLMYAVQDVKAKYSVRSIRPTDAGSVQVNWLRGDVPVVLEFGDFSSDGHAMTQLRGRNEADHTWHDYDLRYRRC